MIHPSDQPLNLTELIRDVQRFAATHFPGLRPVRVTIAFADAAEMVFPVPAVPVRVFVPRVALNEKQEDILTALEEASGPILGKELAVKAGYAYDSQFRSDVAYLVKIGKAVNRNPGYEAVRQEPEGGDG